MRIVICPMLLVAVVALLVSVRSFAEESKATDRLVVHEWGTFTALQDELGRELTGVNVDDEPVPQFVHNLHPYLLGAPVLSRSHWLYRMKGAPRRHPLVTMRLETPVIYFYPPEGEHPTVDVSVQFRGGWLTEFYPQAEADAPGLQKGTFEFGHLSPESVGSLSWRDVQVATSGQPPVTDWKVWNAPRKVNAATITAPSGESEKYLFYRGIGRLRAPLRVTTDREHRQLQVYGNFDDVLSSSQVQQMGEAWLTHIREDGSSAFRVVSLDDVTANTSRQLASTSYMFAKEDYSTKNLQQMKDRMHRALVDDGLYADEATALLTTWERAYFVSPGLRLFFLVPRPWTDHYLPLTISKDADIERVMVGRIELFTDEQRQTLTRLATTPVSDGNWLRALQHGDLSAQFLAGRTVFEQVDLKIPQAFQLYLSLGRFRNALVVEEQRRRPTEYLARLIDVYHLHPYQWQHDVPAAQLAQTPAEQP